MKSHASFVQNKVFFQLISEAGFFSIKKYGWNCSLLHDNQTTKHIWKQYATTKEKEKHTTCFLTHDLGIDLQKP